MPSALETLVKILKLEREQGCKNSAVIGGLAAFSEKWSRDAHTQAKRPEHHILVDELYDLLRQYEANDNRTERQSTIGYMLDRVTGRVPPPEPYRLRLDQYPAAPPSSPSPSREPPPEANAREALPPAETHTETRRREERDRREPQGQREARPEGRGASEGRGGAPAGRERPERPDKRRPQREKPRGRAEDDDGDDDAPIPMGVREERGSESLSYDHYDAPMRGRGRNRGPEPELDIPTQPRLMRVPRRPRPVLSPEAAADALRGLEAPVTVLKGVGPGMAKLLEKLDVLTIKDLLYLFPRRHDDYTRMRSIRQLAADPEQAVTIIGSVMTTEVRVAKGGRRDFFMVIDDGTARMGVMFFGRHFLIRQIRQGQQVVLSGPVTLFGNQFRMVNPEWEALDVDNLHTVGIVPVYPLTEGLSGRSLRKLIRGAIDYWMERIPDYVPEATLERAELADLGWALRQAHFPEGWDHLDHARRRLVFDELLLIQLVMLANRRQWQSVPAVSLQMSDDALSDFIGAVFPYPLTNAQRRAVDDIRRDAITERPMNRLLQGDVGSGKTAVAMISLALAFANGHQAAIMVPTSILAEQHYRSVTVTFEKMPGDRKPVVALLTSALTATERESIYRGMADGSIDIVVGTHALIQEGVEFRSLALVVIDEQHRFGVEQRKALRGKGINPHLLVMTATPIPRTLALTLHADLDLSVMDEMPPGRTPIQTRVVQERDRENVHEFVEAQLVEGRQAFFVHPLVEASDKLEAPAAMEAYERLQQVFHHHKVGLLHGRLKPSEKDEVMAAFANGEYAVLVTTSVAEVGVNVPNATVMVIDGANRFGLAQLHQFRGRVGRGQYASYCLLMAETQSDDAYARLRAMESTTDGFKLAEMDWQLRGAGDLIGTRQSGAGERQLIPPQLASGLTPQLVELAQREARTIVEEDLELTRPEHRLLAQRVEMLHNQRTDVS